MEHEKGLLSDITELRTRAYTNVVGASSQDVSAKFEAADALGAKLQQLFISVKDYPELKSDATMQTAGL